MAEMYEIEIKSLLGTKEEADRLLDALKAHDEHVREVDANTQLNHYFIAGDKQKMLEGFQEVLPKDRYAAFRDIVEQGRDMSVRTRETTKADQKKVILVVKASVDDTTSSNGTARLEFEEVVNITLEELDQKLLESGCVYQAKWSRDRHEYELSDGAHVCVDKNAGYGYVAEFERVIEDGSRADEVKEELRALMTRLGVTELPQDRLERMFAHYNENWPEYYGTDKTFEIR